MEIICFEFKKLKIKKNHRKYDRKKIIKYFDHTRYKYIYLQVEIILK